MLKCYLTRNIRHHLGVHAFLSSGNIIEQRCNHGWFLLWHEDHLIMALPAHDVSRNAEAQLIEFFRSSFLHLHPRFKIALRDSMLWTTNQPHQGTCIEASSYEPPCNEHYWGVGSMLTSIQPSLATNRSHQPQIGLYLALAAAG
jgi:hypothetical protein